jgi:hypothetical protein
MTTKSKTPAAAIDAGMALMRMAERRTEVEQMITDQVHRVLVAGGSWTTISVALGVTRQAAWERYR